MNDSNQKQDEARLRALLSESRSAPSLPPRFHEGVWRRIENADRDIVADNLPWLEVMLRRVLRPRFALATVAALILLGVLLGVREGSETAGHADQARYLDAVAHSVLR